MYNDMYNSFRILFPWYYLIQFQNTSAVKYQLKTIERKEKVTAERYRYTDVQQRSKRNSHSVSFKVVKISILHYSTFNLSLTCVGEVKLPALTKKCWNVKNTFHFPPNKWHKFKLRHLRIRYFCMTCVNYLLPKSSLINTHIHTHIYIHIYTHTNLHTYLHEYLHTYKHKVKYTILDKLGVIHYIIIDKFVFTSQGYTINTL